MVIAADRPVSTPQPVPQARVRAARYVRMSTELQQYSPDNQAQAIALYANQRGFEIVETYADEGRSGLSLTGRPGLQRLLADVESRRAGFEAILIYDVSRLGRFQDTDEAAHCELRCRRAGVTIHYCAEPFENDGTIGSSILKTVKRAMAGEYSRELSVKVFAGQANLARRGYRLGGAAGYGVRRLLIDAQGVAKSELRRGEHKSIATDRIVLVAGPAAECAIVREIFDLFVTHGHSEYAIADLLNARGIPTDLGRTWTRGIVNQILLNEKYIGNNVWGRTAFKLGVRLVRTAPDDWIRSDGVFEVIVDRDIFARAQAIMTARIERFTDADMLDELRSILKEHGRLSSALIDAHDDIPFSTTYRKRFGSLLRAYELVGFTSRRNYRYLDNAALLRAIHRTTLDSAIAGLEAAGARAELDSITGQLTINGEFTARIVVARCYRTEAGSHRWRIALAADFRSDVVIIVRMGGDNEHVRDYYVLPRLDVPEPDLRLYDNNGAALDAYRAVSLAPLFRMAGREPARLSA
ncbi:MAG: site-specific recombinase, invertase Pin [Rhizorhabdus sp.]|nr:site-specific recombinase, invertase Pin [Rhizorhabdus sp.]